MIIHKREILQHFVNLINSYTFFKEFSFSKNSVIPSAGTEIEFSDYVLFCDGYLIIFQLKERSTRSDSDQIEHNWIRNKILKKAKTQLKNSVGFLVNEKSITVTNERGDSFSIEYSKLKKIYKLIVYLYPGKLPTSFIPIKYYVSADIGFVHIFDFVSYKNICDVLFTPIEILKYFDFREQHLSLIFSAKNESEKYLLGRYLLSPKPVDTDLDTKSDDFSEYVDKLEVKIGEYDMRYVFQSIRDKQFYTSGDALDYYKFMTELALLDQLEIAELKKRFKFALEKIEKDAFNINRMISSNTKCGFVFISLQKGDKQDRIKLSKAITHLAKYDMKLEKTLGITFIKESKDMITIYWTYVSYPWEFNKETEITIKETDLFSPLKYRIGKLYEFKI